MLAREKPSGLSARNVFTTRITSLQSAAGHFVAALQRPPLNVLLTEAAVNDLHLEVNSKTHVVLKATAVAYMGPA